jgi:hypothetical protein
MKLMRTENHPTFEVYDETERAIENDYAHSDIQMEEMMFRKHRTALVEFLSSLSLDEWERTALHPEWGVQTIESMAVHILGHDGYHARQIADWLSAAEDSREE